MNEGELSVKKRKYMDEFLKCGFTSIVVAGIEKPQCVICNDVPSAESMKPNKLKRHFDTKHQTFSDKDVQYFKNKADGVKKGRLDAGGRYQQQNVAAVEASYLVALRIAKAKKPHTIAKDLLLPATKDIVSCSCLSFTSCLFIVEQKINIKRSARRQNTSFSKFHFTLFYNIKNS